ncbi:MAG: DNA helicase RecQ [Pseudomonadota bacterium]
MDGASPTAHGLLSDIFGFDGFRPMQEDIVDAVTQGEDVLAILPTGGGKSLCFQLPALLRPGLTVVISPLIALMRDQVRALREAGVSASALTSGNTEEETDAVYRELHEGTLKLLYLAPERLASGGTERLLAQANVTLLAVDEAHCVSQWGHDFRPDYLRIGTLRRALDVPLAAFTATADSETREEIVARLFAGTQPKSFLGGFDRPNIHLAFAPKNKPREQILSFSAARKGQSGIVYCGTRAKTETLAKALTDVGVSALAYHAGMETNLRREVERRFQTDDGLVVVATVAFGMGIDKPDIRWVAHADLPKSIEAYYQEIGRAGRDGAPAETLTLYGSDDIRFRRMQIDEGIAPAERRMADHGRLNALLGLAEAQTCRRQKLLSYFEEDSGPCGHCDLCSTPPEVFDGTEAVMKALSAILRTGEYFGVGHLTDVLVGNATEKVRARGHDRLPTFGVGREFARSQWAAIFRQMMGFDLVRPDSERLGALRMTQAARPVLKGEQAVTLRREVLSKPVRRPSVKALVSEEDAPLLSALKAKRRALAEAQRAPAYIIFPDRTLIEMAEKRPDTLDKMAGIGGVGAKKLERYGEVFLAVITGEAPTNPHPARRKLAGRTAGEIYDQLLATQARLARGADGTGKPMSCSASLLAKIASLGPEASDKIERLLGERLAERFAPAFAKVVRRE